MIAFATAFTAAIHRSFPAACCSVSTVIAAEVSIAATLPPLIPLLSPLSATPVSESSSCGAENDEDDDDAAVVVVVVVEEEEEEEEENGPSLPIAVKDVSSKIPRPLCMLLLRDLDCLLIVANPNVPISGGGTCRETVGNPDENAGGPDGKNGVDDDAFGPRLKDDVEKDDP